MDTSNDPTDRCAPTCAGDRRLPRRRSASGWSDRDAPSMTAASSPVPGTGSAAGVRISPGPMRRTSRDPRGRSRPMAGPSASGRSAYPAPWCSVSGSRSISSRVGSSDGSSPISSDESARTRASKGHPRASPAITSSQVESGMVTPPSSSVSTTGSLCHPLTGQAHGEAGRARLFDERGELAIAGSAARGLAALPAASCHGIPPRLVHPLLPRPARKGCLRRVPASRVPPTGRTRTAAAFT